MSRSFLSLLISACCAALPLLATADELPASPDRMRVLHERHDCASNVLQVEVYDRAESSWVDHPRHPRILAETCQTESAATLLNEIRTRCAEPVTHENWGLWRVGIDLWDPESMRRCEQRFAQRRSEFEIDLEVVSPKSGQTLESEDLEVQVEGSVRLGGREPGHFDVVLAVDVSADMRSLDRQGRAPMYDGIRALREWVSLRTGDGVFRFGLVSFSHGFGGEGASAGAAPEMDVLIGDDLDPMLATLDAVATAPPAAAAGFAEVLALALSELQAEGREGVSRAVVVIADGRADFPFGEGARMDPTYRRRLIEAAAPARELRIPVHVLALDGTSGAVPEVVDEMFAGTRSLWLEVPAQRLSARGLVELPLPTLDAIEIQSSSAGERGKGVVWEPNGRFSARVRLRNGTNILRLRASASTGEVADANLRITLDNARLREVLLEREREHMRDVRSRRKRVVIEAEKESR